MDAFIFIAERGKETKFSNFFRFPRHISGRGMKVLIARFLKNDNSGEVSALSQMEGITVLPCLKNYGFYFQMTEDQKREATEYFGQMFDKAWKEATDQGYDMVILDEIVAAWYLRTGLFSV